MLKYMSHAIHRVNASAISMDVWCNSHTIENGRLTRLVSARPTIHRKDRERIDHNYRPRSFAPPAFRVAPDVDGELYL
jgi:hypothetical protein